MALIGRTQELAYLTTAISRRDRLITLVGPGGIGKTCLAREAARQAGGCFVDASNADSALAVVEAVARQVLATDGETVPINVDAIGRAIDHVRPPVIVVDNLEQVFDAVPATLGVWIEQTPHTTWLTTSRRPLDMADEEVVRLAPLDPTDAAEVFVKAAPSDRRASLAPELVADVAQLLDGIPLALEIAAARLAVLELPALRERLDATLSVLRDPTGRRPARHRTIEATLAWSWRMLEPWQRSALAQVASFAGPFELEAAEAVLDVEPPATVLDALQSLVVHSLLHRDATGGQHVLLETTRSFARDQQTAEERAEVDRRHARWAIDRTTSLRNAFWGGDLQAGRHLHGEAIRDLELALDRAIDRGDRELALRAIPLVFPALTARGALRQADELCRKALALHGPPDASTQSVGRVRACLGIVLAYTGQHEEGRRLGHALTEDAGDDPYLHGAGFLTIARCTPFHASRDAWAAAADCPDPVARSSGLIGLSHHAAEAGRFDRAVALASEATAVARARTSPRTLSMALGAWAMALHKAGRLAEAADVTQESISLARAVGNVYQQCISYVTMGQLHLQMGQVDDAFIHVDTIEEHCRRIGFSGGLATVHTVRAIGLGMGGDPAAADHARAACTVLEQVDTPAWVVSVAALMAAVLAATTPKEAQLALDRATDTLRAAHVDVLTDGGSAEDLVAVAQQVVDAGSPVDRESLERVRRLLQKSLEHAQTQPGLDAALLVALLRARCAQMPEPAAAYLVAASGHWFEPPAQARVHLSQRPSHAGIVAALAKAQLRHRGAPLSRDALVAAGWPGQRIVPSAAANRLRVALSHLRKAGLDIIQHTEGGWRLQAGAPLWVVPPQHGG